MLFQTRISVLCSFTVKLYLCFLIFIALRRRLLNDLTPLSTKLISAVPEIVAVLNWGTIMLDNVLSGCKVMFGDVWLAYSRHDEGSEE